MTKRLTKELVEEANKKSNPDGKAFGLVDHYKKCYEQKYGNEPYVNKHKYKYMALDVLNGYEDYEHVKKVVEYYFVTARQGHPLPYLLNNFHVLMDAYDQEVRDRELRMQRREQLSKIKEEWINGNA